MAWFRVPKVTTGLSRRPRGSPWDPVGSIVGTQGFCGGPPGDPLEILEGPRGPWVPIGGSFSRGRRDFVSSVNSPQTYQIVNIMKQMCENRYCWVQTYHLWLRKLGYQGEPWCILAGSWSKRSSRQSKRLVSGLYGTCSFHKLRDWMKGSPSFENRIGLDRPSMARPSLAWPGKAWPDLARRGQA